MEIVCEAGFDLFAIEGQLSLAHYLSLEIRAHAISFSWEMRGFWEGSSWPTVRSAESVVAAGGTAKSLGIADRFLPVSEWK